MNPKNPATPPRVLRISEDDIVSWKAAILRIYFAGGAHPASWSSMRSWGPARSMRWDHHPEPPQEHDGLGIYYGGADVATCVAEVFQNTRVVDVHAHEPRLVGWVPERPLRLLDLTQQWPLRAGASASLHAAPKPTCRAWSRALHRHETNLDGLLTPSTMTGHPTLVLWERAESAFPGRPRFHRALRDLYPDLHATTQHLNYTLLV